AALAATAGVSPMALLAYHALDATRVGLAKRPRDDAGGPLETSAERKGQRREPAADDVRFVSERIGWLPFAGPSGWAFFALRLSRICRISTTYCVPSVTPFPAFL